MDRDKSRKIAENWLERLGQYFEDRDYSGVARLMLEDGYWRDLLTFRWRFENYHGVREIETWLRHVANSNPLYNFRIEGDPTVSSIGEHSQTLEFFFRFETELANGRGFVRLVGGPNSWNEPKAFTLLTSMHELKAFPEANASNPVQGRFAGYGQPCGKLAGSSKLSVSVRRRGPGCAGCRRRPSGSDARRAARRA